MTDKYLLDSFNIISLLDLQNIDKCNFEVIPAHVVLYYDCLNRSHEEMVCFFKQIDQVLSRKVGIQLQLVDVTIYKIKYNFASTRLDICMTIKIDSRWILPEFADTNTILKFFRRLFVEVPDSNDQVTEISVNRLNEITTTIRENFYGLPQTSAQAWAYLAVSAEVDEFNASDKFRLSACNLAMYPGVAKNLLQFSGVIVLSDVGAEYCFDDEYCLNYVRNKPRLQKIFKLTEGEWRDERN